MQQFSRTFEGWFIYIIFILELLFLIKKQIYRYPRENFTVYV